MGPLLVSHTLRPAFTGLLGLSPTVLETKRMVVVFITFFSAVIKYPNERESRESISLGSPRV